MTLEQIILLIIAGVGAIWGLVKWVVPRFVDARIESEKDSREHRQKMDELQAQYFKAESESTYQMMGSLLEKSQDKEAKAYEFITQTVFNTLDVIKTNVRLLPEIQMELKALKHEIRNLATHQILLRSIITKQVEEEDYRRSTDLAEDEHEQ